MKLLFTVALFALSFSLFSQKKVLDPSVYNDWKRLSNSIISDNGKFASYEIKPHRGDGYLYYLNTKSLTKDSIYRGKSARFIGNGNYLSFLITPGFDTLRTLELEKVKKDTWVRDTLAILNLSTNEITKIPDFLARTQAKKSAWFAYTVNSNGEAEKEKKKCRIFGRKKNVAEIESDGKLLTIENLETAQKLEFKNVTSFSFDEKGKLMFLVFHEKIDGKDNYTPAILTLIDGSLVKGNGSFSAFSSHRISESGDKIAFLASNDTVEKKKLFDLYLWSTSSSNFTLLADTTVLERFDNKTVSAFKKPTFSKNGSMIYFGIKERPEQDPEDTLIASEKVSLDLWHYEDDRLQPQQLLEKSRDEKKTTLLSYSMLFDKFSLLSNDTLDVYIDPKNKTKLELAVSNERYKGSYNWSYPWPSDYYIVNTMTGDSELLVENLGYGGSLSPNRKYFTFFNSKDQQHYILNIETKKKTCITCGSKANWSYDVNGMPHEASSQGVAGFTSEEKSILIYSEFDIYEYQIDTKSLVNITALQGAVNRTKFRLKKWSQDSVYFDWTTSYLTSYNKITKEEGVYSIATHGNHYDIEKLYESNHKILGITKAKNSDEVIFRQMSAIDYPDAQLSNTSFINPVKISNTNPQQSEYNWTTVESIYWTSYDSIPLEGLLYKPENFDSTKSYPLMVYFYELYSDDYHNHNAPRPTASIIFPTEYASAGYFVFIPDVRYKEGHPAQSAYDCILSGTDRVLEKYPCVDSSRMALQGQSWGGYQTAQLVTMTNRYKAAMAGAPVSNMFSAYGGIRWGSGLNRQFQYERTQSRIGKTIWEAPELYVENSPIFGVPNIETPLLIMHNDNDGAVPWYQGIEMFTAMKRLGKPVWMLNYNGDQHNLMRNANRMDLSIRMRQFFDHYLLDAPAPTWLKDGIPATLKGKDYRLGY